MTALAEKIYNEALDLPTEERLTLLDRLLHINSIGIDPDIDKAWCKEVERRDRQIDVGSAKLVSGEDVVQKIQQRLSR